jgi:hypothetical protein
VRRPCARRRDRLLDRPWAFSGSFRPMAYKIWYITGIVSAVVWIAFATVATLTV